MAMKRRHFLRLFGSALAVPAMPLPSVAKVATATAGYSRAAFHAAIMHAKTRVSFSVWGLASTLNVPVAQAEQMMADMAERGILGPLSGSTTGGRWAQSRVMQHDIYGAANTSLRAARASRAHSTPSREIQRHSEPDLGLILAHLRGLCLKQGMTLSPRCAAYS